MNMSIQCTIPHNFRTFDEANLHTEFGLPCPLSFARQTTNTYLMSGIRVREYIINERAPTTSSGSEIPWGNVL